MPGPTSPLRVPGVSVPPLTPKNPWSTLHQDEASTGSVNLDEELVAVQNPLRLIPEHIELLAGQAVLTFVDHADAGFAGRAGPRWVG